MNFRAYFMGERQQLSSALSTAEVADRINLAAAPCFSPFSLGVTGGVRRGRVCLRYAKSPFEYNAKPVLTGQLEPTPDGSRLELVYRAPLWAYVFYAFWYSTLIGLAVSILLVPTVDATAAGNAFSLAVFVALTALPLVLHALGTRDADLERDTLVQFLEDNVQGI